jgi:formate hydrogenlyase subunit 3/multisubunit Na+/H+ antiporter MnhD subunit
MSTLQLLLCVAAHFALAAAGIALKRSSVRTFVVYAGCLIVTTIALVVAVGFLVGDLAPSDVVLPVGLPWLGAHFRLDPLSAFFIAVVNLGAAAASLFAIGYGRHETEPSRVLPFYPVFLAGMNLVVLAADAFSFLVSWEFMSLASWALVVAHHRSRENVEAGYIYLVMASFGALALLLAFGLLAGPAGDYAFESIREMQRSPVLTSIILALVLVGAGSKAGLVPLHVWLPLAHPAAPSHVSALMSGVMTKVAVYAFIRIAFDLVGPMEWWWSMVVLALGGLTSGLGILYALMQRDIKRMLAYSTVENIGVIFIALGLALAFRANGLAPAAALALTAALFHVFNHSLFKSLLFFGSGAILSATGERNMERLGGLIHRMPQTAFCFLVGSVAISALPPLNGFVSEWMTFQAILLSPGLPQWGLILLVPAIGALLALSAALVAACFVRAFGTTFLGRARTGAPLTAHETDGVSLAAMFVLTGLCMAAGVFPGVVIDALAPAVRGLVGEGAAVQALQSYLSIVPVSGSRNTYSGFLIFMFTIVAAVLTALLVHALAGRKLRRSAAWDCGFPDSGTQLQYTASSFAQPIRRVFGAMIFRARETVSMPPPGEVTPARFAVVWRDLVWDAFYAPVSGLVQIVSERLNMLQFLTIRRYLGLVFFALVFLLLVLALWQ